MLLDRYRLCLVSDVCPYLVWSTVLFLYLGTLVLTSLVDDQPPSSVLPRMLFMVAVAILVERRGGRPSNLKYSTSLLYETILTILVCNLALTLVWDQVEKIVHLTLYPFVVILERLFGQFLTCGGCQGVQQLQLFVTTIIAMIIFIWVLYSVTTLPLIQRPIGSSLSVDVPWEADGQSPSGWKPWYGGSRNVWQCLCGKGSAVRFLTRVEVRFINPRTHLPEGATQEEIQAPKGPGRNPLVPPPSFPLPLD